MCRETMRRGGLVIKVSIVVPIYNAEKTLINCLKGLLMQTLKEIEIICVDDCSTDNTYAMLEMIEAQYPEKVVLIKNDRNRGPGGARNTGIQYTRGEYIGFVDSDDEVAIDMFEKLYAKAKEVQDGYDMVECGFYKEETDTTILYATDDLCGALDSTKRNELISCGGYVYTKIYKKDLIDNMGFGFRDNIALEDSEFVAYTYAIAKNIANVKEALYCYKDTDNSLSKQTKHLKNYKACFEAMKALYKRLSSISYYNEISMSVEYEMVQLYVYALISILSWFKQDKLANEQDTLLALKELQKFSDQCISIPYASNRFICKKIKDEDLQLAKINDKNPAQLIKLI